MQAIVETLCSLNGVKHAGLYKNGDMITANFADPQLTAMTKSSHIMSQLFLALESVGKSHNELYFGINDGYLAAFRLHANYHALLLTDKKINLPMLSMAIKSASTSLKQRLEAEQAERDRLEYLANIDSPMGQMVPVEVSLLPVFEQYTQLLTEHLGPAASVVVEDAVDTWKQTYLQTINNLPYLLAMLEEELDSDTERQAFLAKATGVTIPST